MARQEIVLYKDDLDGTEKDVRPVKFALDGTEYQIDLGPKNHDKLKKILAPYVEAGSKISSRAGGAGRATSGRRVAAAAEQKEFNAHVRAWAAANGHDVRPRGRIPEAVIDAYMKAGKK